MRIAKLTSPESTHYCKQQLKGGLPIIVENLETGKKYSTNAWRRIVYDEYGDPWVAEMLYDPDVVDKSGARVKLELRRLR